MPKRCGGTAPGGRMRKLKLVKSRSLIIGTRFFVSLSRYTNNIIPGKRFSIWTMDGGMCLVLRNTEIQITVG